jgi:hypothetical protein
MRRDRASLLERMADLERRDRGPEVRLALAEAEFRLALAPGTEPDEAVTRLRHAIAHDPFSAKAHLHLGRVLHHGGRRWAALAAYREAYRLAPAGRRAPLLMASALLDLDRPEREIGSALLLACAADAGAEIAAAVGDFDALVDRRAAGGGGPAEAEAPAAAKPARRRRKAPAAGESAVAHAPADAWRELLREQLGRKPPNERWITTYLRAAPGGPDAGGTELATAAVLLLTCGAEPGDVRAALADVLARLPAAHPGVRMLTATLDLAAENDPAAFTRQAARLVEGRVVPAEVACALHFGKYGDEPHDPVRALRLLDTYPEPVRTLDAFQELRLAVLDGHARRAWAAERFAEAGVLWQATVRVDPYRVAVAVNLALLAARTHSSAYRSAWERVAELLYLHAAAAGDCVHLADDRVGLHRTLSLQSLGRAGDTNPSGAAVPRWIADGDAVDVWLRHWDLYYLNSRLRFRSPSHLLGVPSDVGPEQLDAARDGLLRHLADAFRTEDWAGTEAFLDLARQRVCDAREQAARRPTADPHREREQAAADKLLDEAKRRVLLLHSVALALRSSTPARHRRLACAVIRHQFALPLDRLHQLCADQGLLGADEHLVAIVEQDAVLLATGWGRTAPAGVSDPERMLADVEAAVRAAPDRLGLRLAYGRLLAWAGEPARAYATAAEAVTRITAESAPDPARTRLRDLLVTLVDDVAETELERDADDPGYDAVARARQAMTDFPVSAAPRIALALAVSRERDEAGTDEAVLLLAVGIRTARTESQARRARAALRALRAADQAVRRHVHGLRKRALAGLQEASTGDRARALTAAVADIDHAVVLARARRLDADVVHLTSVLTWLRQQGGTP